MITTEQAREEQKAKRVKADGYDHIMSLDGIELWIRLEPGRSYFQILRASPLTYPKWKIDVAHIGKMHINLVADDPMIRYLIKLKRMP